MMSNYDMIISLGGNCSAATHLRRRGLRPYSLPFDWLYMEDGHTIDYLKIGFKNGFSDFCLKENLIPISKSGQGEAGTARYAYKDTISGYCFVHHFHKSIEEGGYDAVYDTLKRRMQRMFSRIESARSILFLLATAFPYSFDKADELLKILRDMYCDKTIDLFVEQKGTTFSDDSIIGRKIIGYGFDGEVYSAGHATPDWAFLDKISLNGASQKPIKGIDKLYYKLWKSLSRRFLIGGYALDKLSYRK